MAGTRNLDWLTHYARERGAAVWMLGDPAQLTSVEAGGALRLLAHYAGAVVRDFRAAHSAPPPGRSNRLADVVARGSRSELDPRLRMEM